jgi:Tat protein translocase TatB subunit
MNLGMSEIVIILIVALIVIGPKRLPDVAKSVGKGYGEFKKMFNDMKKTVDITSNEPVQTTRPSQSTYKSRWEEQATPAVTTESPTTAEPAAAEADATESTTPRAKRSDLVKEEENGNG